MALWLQRFTKPSPTNAPPTQREMLRNDLLVAGLVLFALFLGLGIRNQVYNASKSARLGEGMPKLEYPARWVPRNAEDTLFSAYDSGSPSTFDAQLTVNGRTLGVDESLEQARAGRGLNLATSLPGFRELSAEELMVYRNQPALVSTYAYIVDPTRDSGVTDLPVVVEAQEIMFIDDGQFIVVTVAADASQWADQQRDFQLIFDSMRLRPMPESRPTPTPTPVPGATPASEEPGSFSGGGGQHGAGAGTGEGTEGGD